MRCNFTKKCFLENSYGHRVNRTLYYVIRTESFHECKVAMGKNVAMGKGKSVM